MKNTFPDIEALSSREKLLLIETLWDSLSANPENIAVPDWQIEELRRRKEEYLRDPSSGLSWEEVKERILHGNR